MSYRSAAAVLKALLPVHAGGRPETLRNHTLRTGEELRCSPAILPAAAQSELSISLDSTYIRSCEPGERHIEVRVGNVETRAGTRHVFARAFQADGRAINEKLRLYVRVGAALIAARKGGQDPYEAITAVMIARR